MPFSSVSIVDFEQVIVSWDHDQVVVSERNTSLLNVNF